MYLVGERNNPWCLVSVLVGLYIGQDRNNKTINKQTNHLLSQGLSSYRSLAPGGGKMIGPGTKVAN